ncbi:exodeoxyribonuclease III [Cellulomonas endophytica]|uniref:exodeoxyribonuclease III n=1 Tax=Cellulomonas endophytica TaxID=2494735 RepID=UPI001011877B|nr:exodeoxyribonuclease III [Cellulomonas endophytica]
MRLVTWNVNSVRARLERVVAFCERAAPDVLALQETKCTAEAFPREPLEALGYEVAAAGHSQWNGVALLSRVGLADVEEGFPGQPAWGDPPRTEARALGATCGGVRVWSLYVPNGRTLDDPHLAYKLDWLARLRDAAAAWRTADPGAAVALVGDWNIAPADDDVWDPTAFVGSTHVSPAERAAFAAVGDAGYREVTREHLPEPHTFTYWDYQRLRFARREGMRIDLAYASRALADRVTGVRVDRDERKGKGASDHAPVVLDVADA